MTGRWKPTRGTLASWSVAILASLYARTIKKSKARGVTYGRWHDLQNEHSPWIACGLNVRLGGRGGTPFGQCVRWLEENGLVRQTRGGRWHVTEATRQLFASEEVWCAVGRLLTPVDQMGGV